MHSRRVALSVCLSVMGLAWIAPGAVALAPTVQDFTTVGESTFTVPASVRQLTVTAIGAGGGGGHLAGCAGGKGAQVTSMVSVTPGELLYVDVGGQGADAQNGGVHNAGGANGGGAGGLDGAGDSAGGGGGASDVRTAAAASGLSPDTRLVVAGGGGGGADNFGGCSGGAGGATPGAGASSGTAGGGGAGGSATGGAAGSSASGCDAATAGSLGAGGAGGSNASTCLVGGGGGGGGYFGGGGGGGGGGGSAGAGGGAGSNFAGPSTTNTSVTTATQATGEVQISYLAAPNGQTFTTVGEQTFTVPAGVTEVDVAALGAAGGTGSTNNPGPCAHNVGGNGAQVTSLLRVTPGEVLYVEVGGQGGDALVGPHGPGVHPAGGSNGGGPGGAGNSIGTGGGGGGASDVRTVPAASGLSPDTRLVVAGGGGGAGDDPGGCSLGGVGGATPGSGQSAGAGSGGGGAGGFASGGTAGSTPSACGPAAAGSLGSGGTGGAVFSDNNCFGGGGGGGGYYGAGGGGAGDFFGGGGPGSGGGAGSNHVDVSGSGTVVATAPQATGAVTISFFHAPSAVIASPSTGGSYALGASAPTSFSCAESSDGPGLVSCVDSAGRSGSSGSLDTSTVGPHSYTVTATSADGSVGTASISYAVFRSPVRVTGPAIAGNAKPGRSLSCSQGRWTNAPTGFAYQWSRNGTPISGATSATYRVRAIDEGNSLTCTVIASNVAGAGRSATSAAVRVPVPRVARCPGATGSARGTGIGPVRLGMTRAQAERAFTRSSNRGTRYEEFFCLTPIGIRVGYASPKLLASVPAAERGRLRGRVVWISTASAFYAIQGIPPGRDARGRPQEAEAFGRVPRRGERLVSRAGRLGDCGAEGQAWDRAGDRDRR